MLGIMVRPINVGFPAGHFRVLPCSASRRPCPARAAPPRRAPVTNAEVVAARERAGRIEAVDVLDRKSKATSQLTAQAVIAALGFTADISALESWGLEVADRRLVVGTSMATSRDRVYAAGDITEYPGKVRLIAVGFGEAATAVNNAVAALDPHASLFPGHSSDLTGHPNDTGLSSRSVGLTAPSSDLPGHATAA